MSWHAHIITAYPELFPGALGHSLAGRALANKIWQFTTHDIREFGIGKHFAIDDTPAGGGVGMVMRADVGKSAIEAARKSAPDLPLLLLSPRGKPLQQNRVIELSQGKGALFFCNRFEGIDQRLITHYDMEEISVGDYVLSGGEIACFAVLDAIIRLLPGVMGRSESAASESFSAHLLEYPHYTKPAQWQGQDIPPVLRSGDHAAIASWRQDMAEQLTRARRPDLWQKFLAKNRKNTKTRKNT